MPKVMYGFLQTKLDTRSADGRNDVLLSELHFRDDDSKIYKVPIGAETDGGSTPRIAWLIPGFEPFGKHWLPWVLHDSAYRNTLIIVMVNGDRLAKLTRKEADDLLDRALMSKGLDKARRILVRTALRWFGWREWNQNRKHAI
jgi:hypothetical protein